MAAVHGRVSESLRRQQHSTPSAIRIGLRTLDYHLVAQTTPLLRCDVHVLLTFDFSGLVGCTYIGMLCTKFTTNRSSLRGVWAYNV